MSRWHASVITLFPEMFPGPLGVSLAGKALEEGIWQIDAIQLRDFGFGKHRTVDDRPFGGGAGMVIRPDVAAAAIDHARESAPGLPLIHFSPRGVPMAQPRIRQSVEEGGAIFLCGRYEGIDDRVIAKYGIEEISLGDFVLSGGELPALAFIDAVVRLLPGVMGEEESHAQESFGSDEKYAGLLEYPHYTRPPAWEGLLVPEILSSGHHAQVDAWRFEQAKDVTRQRRPDLWEAWLRRQKEIGNT